MHAVAVECGISFAGFCAVCGVHVQLPRARAKRQPNEPAGQLARGGQTSENVFICCCYLKCWRVRGYRPLDNPTLDVGVGWEAVIVVGG